MAARAPRVQYMRSPADLDRIEFRDDLAAVEVPAELIDALPLKNDRRQDGPRLRRIMHAIRRQGYVPTEPIICRIGMKGRWVVVDGGHRLTAVRRLREGFWARLFPPDIGTLYFLLFTTPGSWSKVREIAREAGAAPPVAPSLDEPADEA